MVWWAAGNTASTHNIRTPRSTTTHHRSLRALDPALHACVQVSEGSGKLLVTAVGDNSEWGKTIRLVTSSGDEQTPLQEKLAHVAGTVGKIGATVAATCFFALLVRADCVCAWPARQRRAHCVPFWHSSASRRARRAAFTPPLSPPAAPCHAAGGHRAQIKWCVVNRGFPLHKVNQNGPVQFFL
jgi:hypothetical protein